MSRFAPREGGRPQEWATHRLHTAIAPLTWSGSRLQSQSARPSAHLKASLAFLSALLSYSRSVLTTSDPFVSADSGSLASSIPHYARSIHCHRAGPVRCSFRPCIRRSRHWVRCVSGLVAATSHTYAPADNAPFGAFGQARCRPPSSATLCMLGRRGFSHDPRS